MPTVTCCGKMESPMARRLSALKTGRLMGWLLLWTARRRGAEQSGRLRDASVAGRRAALQRTSLQNRVQLAARVHDIGFLPARIRQHQLPCDVGEREPMCVMQRHDPRFERRERPMY